MTAWHRGLGWQLNDLSCVAAARRGGAGGFSADRRSCAQEMLVVKPGSSQRPSHLHGAPNLESRGTGPELQAMPHLARSGQARREQVGVCLVRLKSVVFGSWELVSFRLVGPPCAGEGASAHGPNRCLSDQCACPSGRCRRPSYWVWGVGCGFHDMARTQHAELSSWSPPVFVFPKEERTVNPSNRNASFAPRRTLLGVPGGGCGWAQGLRHRRCGCGGTCTRPSLTASGLCLFPQSKSTGTWTSTR